MATRAEDIYNRMAGIKPTRTLAEPVSVPVDVPDYQADDRSEDGTEDAMDESRGPLEESGATHDESSEEEVEDAVAEDIMRFEQSFKNITQRYRLINRIGEGASLLLLVVGRCF